jgi:hypothetical protein
MGGRKFQEAVAMKQYNRQIRVGLCVFVGCILLAGCSLQRAATPTPEQADIAQPEASTPTPTAVLIPGELDEPTEEIPPSPPTAGEIELRFTDPESQKECVATFPFEIVEQPGLRKIEGSGVLNCKFETQQCGEGVCINYHSEYYMDAGLSGVIHPASTDFPDGFLEAGLGGTFTMTQYWTDVPPESFVAFTKEHPSVFSGSDIIPLNFNFAEGATEEAGNPASQFPWVFRLHLR